MSPGAVATPSIGSDQETAGTLKCHFKSLSILNAQDAMGLALQRESGNKLCSRFSGNRWSASVAGTNFDQVAITGALNLSGAGTDDIVLDITSLTAGNVAGNVPNFAETDEDWIILTTTGGITGFDVADWSVLVTNFSSSPSATGTWSVSQVGNDVVLSYTAIPEPTVTALILAGASLGFLSMGRKRRH